MKKRRKIWPDERKRFIAQAGGVCIYCKRLYNPIAAKYNKKKFFSDWEIDHIIPLSRGGNNADSNLHAVCKRCNQLKSDMSLLDFYTLLRKRKRY